MESTYILKIARGTRSYIWNITGVHGDSSTPSMIAMKTRSEWKWTRIESWFNSGLQSMFNFD